MGYFRKNTLFWFQSINLKFRCEYIKNCQIEWVFVTLIHLMHLAHLIFNPQPGYFGPPYDTWLPTVETSVITILGSIGFTKNASGFFL